MLHFTDDLPTYRRSDIKPRIPMKQGSRLVQGSYSLCCELPEVCVGRCCNVACARLSAPGQQPVGALPGRCLSTQPPHSAPALLLGTKFLGDGSRN